ncbi:MAG: hypothetical protein ACKVOU_05215 [Cytophagales bacterium]
MKLTLAMLIAAMMIVACSQRKIASEVEAKTGKCCSKNRLLY